MSDGNPPKRALLNSERMKLAGSLPAGFRRDFDAHVYYEMERRERALAFRSEAIAALRHLPILIGDLIDRKVGPHPLPMFEINFSRQERDEMLRWLEEHRGGLTVLVHEVTGHDLRDHCEGALWLGPELALDRSKLSP